MFSFCCIYFIYIYLSCFCLRFCFVFVLLNVLFFVSVFNKSLYCVCVCVFFCFVFFFQNHFNKAYSNLSKLFLDNWFLILCFNFVSWHMPGTESFNYSIVTLSFLAL